MRTRLILLLAIFLPSLSAAQDIKYEKYTLDNGLTIILHENHALPVVTVNLWYRVGAQNEPKGRSGFAHLFEHLMFMGTERVPGSDFDNLMEAGGGSNNASTSLDRTNYYSSGPSSLLPTLLWLEADRLEELGPKMTKDKLDRQRDIVRNEIRQNVENTPYGRLEDYITRYMYPVDHPYHWAVYGLHEDLEAATVDDVKGFFATFYVPNNCSMVVAGDFDSATIKPMIAALFNAIPRGGDVARRAPADVPNPHLGRIVRTTMLDKVDLPRIRMAYHSPAHFAEGDADLDLAAAVLADGKSSRLYKRLVLDEKLATEVAAVQDSGALGSEFFIDVNAVPAADLARVEQVIDEEIKRFTESGPTQAELDQRRATIELATLERLESIDAVADRLNAYEYAFAEPNSFKRDLDRYRNATIQSVQQWAARTLTPESRGIIRVVPEETERAESARDIKPINFDTKPFAPAQPEQFKLSNGIPVWFWRRPEVPLVSVELLIDHGGPICPADQAGLTFLAAKMLGEGAGDRDAVAFGDAVQALGATFAARADRHTFALDMSVLARNVDKAVGLLADAALRPRLTAPDFERVKRLHLEELQQDLNDPSSVGGRVASRRLFGDGHPYAMPIDGFVSTVQSLSLDQVKALSAAAMTPAHATILVSGDLTAEQARAVLDAALGDWKAAPGFEPIKPLATPAIADVSSSGLRVYVVDRPGAVQTVIRFAAPAPRLADPSRPKLRVLNTLLGGSFTSRLNQNLREAHGYTYGAGSRFNMLPAAGFFIASSNVKADVTGAALGEFLNEFARIRGGPLGATFVAAPNGDISDQEIIKAVQTLRTETIQSFSGHAGPMQATAALLPAGLSFETIAADLSAVQSITAADLNAMTYAALPLERAVLVLVGDKALILEQIKALKLPAPITLTAEGGAIK